MKKTLIIFFLLSFFNLAAFVGAAPLTSNPPTEVQPVISQPSGWNPPDWQKALFVLGVTGGFYAFDRQIQAEFQENRNSTSNQVSKYATPFGDPKYMAPVLGLAYGYGSITKDSKFRKTALMSVESLFLANGFTGALKLATQRDRPYLGQGPYVFNGPSLSTNNDMLSFPSAHAASAFSIASVVASEYGKRGYVPPLAYGIATLTALSRINDNQHWASDVFFGSALGYFAGKIIVHLNDNPSNGLLIIPTASGRAPGILVQKSF